MHNILVIDDELSIRESFLLILEDHYNVLTAASGEAALKTVADQKIDLVFLDIRMPGLQGLETLQRIKKINQNIEVIMVTAVNDVQKANEAIRYGARNYLVKPFDVNEILKLTKQTLLKKTIQHESLRLQNDQGAAETTLTGQSEKISLIRQQLAQLKQGENVLLIGEHGTEKELVARLIHQQFFGPTAPFKKIDLSKDCSPKKIANLLFGKGLGDNVFSLDVQNGLLEEAAGGTLLINQLDLLPETILQKLQAKAFARSGSLAQQTMTTCLIGSVPPDQIAKVDYFATAKIFLPALKERLADLPLLLSQLLLKYNQLLGTKAVFAPDALEALTNYAWPGNTAQVETFIKRLLISQQPKTITQDDLPFEVLLGTASAGQGHLATFEKQYIREVFLSLGKDKGKTAAFLDLSPLVLDVKLPGAGVEPAQDLSPEGF